MPEVQELLGDENFELLLNMKAIHDKGMLSSLMEGYEFLSQARVAAYEEHKADLILLKKVLKKYDANQYRTMFRIMQDYNYSVYVGSVNSHKKVRRGAKKSREEFLKYVKNVINNQKIFPFEGIKRIYCTIVKRVDTFFKEKYLRTVGLFPV